MLGKVTNKNNSTRKISTKHCKISRINACANKKIQKIHAVYLKTYEHNDYGKEEHGQGGADHGNGVLRSGALGVLLIQKKNKFVVRKH